jgi:hypothetical protein
MPTTTLLLTREEISKPSKGNRFLVEPVLMTCVLLAYSDERIKLLTLSKISN